MLLPGTFMPSSIRGTKSDAVFGLDLHILGGGLHGPAQGQCLISIKKGLTFRRPAVVVRSGHWHTQICQSLNQQRRRCVSVSVDSKCLGLINVGLDIIGVEALVRFAFGF